MAVALPRSPDYVFDISVATGEVVLHTSELEPILTMPFAGRRARVSIWVDHPVWPDEVIFGVA